MIKLAGPLVSATIDLYVAVASHFLPSAVKFHYNFNMRDMANVFQGMCLAQVPARSALRVLNLVR